MEHDRIFNHLRQRLASKGHLADTPSWGKCLQCRSAHLCEYTCHVALIINKGMCQLLTGDGGKQPGRWVPALPCQPEAALTSAQRCRAPTANIQRRANWTQLSGAERAPREALPLHQHSFVAHARCCYTERVTHKTQVT